LLLLNAVLVAVNFPLLYIAPPFCAEEEVCILSPSNDKVPLLYIAPPLFLSLAFCMVNDFSSTFAATVIVCFFWLFIVVVFVESPMSFRFFPMYIPDSL